MLFRRLAAVACGLVLTGCLMIEERHVDPSALADYLPELEQGGLYDYCIVAPDNPEECEPVRIGQTSRGGADWLRLTSPEDNEPLDLLFFRDPRAGELALLRIADPQEEEGVMMLGFVEPMEDGIVVQIPACGKKAPEGITGWAALEGAQVDDEGCMFESMAGLLATAARVSGTPAAAAFGTITIRR